MSLLAASLIGAGASLAGSALSASSASSQNALAREQFDRQLQWQRYQYNDMKRYNSPANQVRLMKEAGLNPALVTEHLGNSTAVGVGSPSPTASSTQPDFSGLNVAADIAAQYDLRHSESSFNRASTEKVEAEKEGQEIVNQYKGADMLAEIEKKLSDRRLSSAMRNYYNVQKFLLQAKMDTAYSDAQWENELKRMEVQDKALDIVYKNLINQFLPELQGAQLAQLRSIVESNRAMARNYNWSSNKLKQEITSEVIRSGILGLEYSVKRPLGLKADTYYEAMKNNPKFRRFDTAIDNLLEKLDRMPVSFSVSP